MFKLKLWSLSTFAIIYVLLASASDRVSRVSAQSNSTYSQKDLAVSDSLEKDKDSQSDDFNWLWLGLPLGCGTLGGITYLLKRSQQNDSEIGRETETTNNAASANVGRANHNTKRSPHSKKKQSRSSGSWQQLEQLQKDWQQLESPCEGLIQIIQGCVEENLLPETLLQEAQQTISQIKSYNFRIAVVGEFSKGKSTLLNALLEEEIQPVRAIACSGTLSVLKYGERKRVICRYKNGTETEIPFEEYKVKAAISEAAAVGNRSEELKQSQLSEIIFEHPELDLCRYGVEIIDSPGLNEHPERTAITMKLLEDTDAVIFLTSALQVLTQGERELLQDLITQLNSGDRNERANNLFVVVNFMDQLQTEADRLQVKQLVANFLQGDRSLIEGENRIHFISAYQALQANLSGKQNNYSDEFKGFTSSIENFLSTERRVIKLQQTKFQINSLVKTCLTALEKTEFNWSEKLKESDTKIKELFDRIGEASACDYRIMISAEELSDRAFEEAAESWEKWADGLFERLAQKAEHWSSEYNSVLEQKDVIQDFTNQFMRDIEQEIKYFSETEIQNKILNPKLQTLEKQIRDELAKVKESFSSLENNTTYNEQFKFDFSGVEGTWGDFWGYLFGGVAGGGLGAGVMLLEFFMGPVVIAAAIGAGLVGALGFGTGGIKNKIRQKVLEAGWEKFVEASDELFDKVNETINTVFNNRVESATKAIQKAISICENLIEEEEKTHQKLLEEYEVHKTNILQKHQHITQAHNEIENLLK